MKMEYFHHSLQNGIFDHEQYIIMRGSSNNFGTEIPEQMLRTFHEYVQIWKKEKKESQIIFCE
jgi:hypothetical protein